MTCCCMEEFLAEIAAQLDFRQLHTVGWSLFNYLAHNFTLLDHSWRSDNFFREKSFENSLYSTCL